MSRFKSAEEMQEIQRKQAIISERQAREFVPEKNESKAVAYFEIGRYTKGSFRGLFLVHQLILDDQHGKPLKKPIRKTLAEGVDIVVAISSLETALRRRVFK